MKTLELLKEELVGKIYTENGDMANNTTKSKNLDFFSIAGASRHNPSQVLALFKEAIKEDFELSILNLFYSRDVRGGLGERDGFRICFKYLCENYPDIAKLLFEFVVEYGRYDDLLVGLKTKVEKDLIAFLKKQLAEDLESKKTKGTCSLLAKWMPSINASKKETVHMALYLASALQYSKEEYRKLLSFLRKDMIIENNLREKDYTFDYESVPGKALYKYQSAFVRNDNDRYYEYLNRVKEGITDIKTTTVYPYEIVKEFDDDIEDIEVDAMNERWSALKRNANLKNTIVVRDGSGSMTWMNGLPMYIATSMAILCSEQLSGEFKDSFITFSSKPELVTLPENAPLNEKLKVCYQYGDWTNTDIEKVYDLIYRTSLRIKKTEDYIKKIVIISDMEFDAGTKNVPTYESMEAKFKKANLPLPTIVYWNVAARKVHFASNIQHPNVQFVSGASVSVIDTIMNGENCDAITLMKKALEKYNKIIRRLRAIGVLYDRS